MHHSFFDKHSDLKSPIQRLDARPKIVAAILILSCIVTTPVSRPLAFGAYAAMLALFWFVARLPFFHLIKRIAVVLPFILIMTLSAMWTGFQDRSGNSVVIASYILIRAVLAILVLTLLTSTTPFPVLLNAMQSLHVPKIVLSLLSFIYRFGYILIDEFERLDMGRTSRNFTNNIALAWKSRTWMLGTFMIRSLERSERVYQAMMSRGFTGKMISRELDAKIPLQHLLLCALAAAFYILIRIGVAYASID